MPPRKGTSSFYRARGVSWRCNTFQIAQLRRVGQAQVPPAMHCCTAAAAYGCVSNRMEQLGGPFLPGTLQFVVLLLVSLNQATRLHSKRHILSSKLASGFPASNQFPRGCCFAADSVWRCSTRFPICLLQEPWVQCQQQTTNSGTLTSWRCLLSKTKKCASTRTTTPQIRVALFGRGNER